MSKLSKAAVLVAMAACTFTSVGVASLVRVIMAVSDGAMEWDETEW